jgi:hypothetical protein
MEIHRAVRRPAFHIFETIESQMAVKSALRTGHPLSPGRLLVHISVRGWVDPRAILRLEGLSEFEKSNDLVENRTREFPTCSIVPQPTTLPRAPSQNAVAEAMGVSVTLLWKWNKMDKVTTLEKVAPPIKLQMGNANDTRSPFATSMN